MGSGGIYGFEPNPAGIAQIFKSGGMQSALNAVVSPIAAAANANFGLKAGDLVPLEVKNGTVQDVKFNGTPNMAPYGSFVDVADYTAIGKVVCMTELGAYDNSIHNTIAKSR